MFAAGGSQVVAPPERQQPMRRRYQLDVRQTQAERGSIGTADRCEPSVLCPQQLSIGVPSTRKGPGRREYSRPATSSVQSDLLEDLSVSTGTMSSNPACSSGESVSAVHSEAAREKSRAFAGLYA